MADFNFADIFRNSGNGLPAQPTGVVPPAQNPVLMQSNLQGISQMGIPKNDHSIRMLSYYAKRYPFLSSYISDPAKLMGFIDVVSKRESNRSPGSQYDGFAINTAKNILSELYGINDYTPRGFLKEDKELPNQVPGASAWQNPRPAAGEMLRGAFGEKINR